MSLFARTGPVGERLKDEPGLMLLSSADGVHWTWRGRTGPSRDNTTFFYNPFRKVWVFSHRVRAEGKYRARAYWESPDFFAALGDGFKTRKPAFWSRADNLDRPDPEIRDAPQIYKIDAGGSESLMLGLFEILYGPANEVCGRRGTPKITELQVAFSRDGFYWDRRRKPFIAPTRKPGDWERGYISSCGGCCLVVGDELWFYYGAFRGDETNRPEYHTWGGMYADASTGLARLRRDGFASMDAGPEGGSLTTRPVVFQGRHLFVNLAAPGGELRVEVLDQAGAVVATSRPLSGDKTLLRVDWQGAADLSAFAGRPVRFRFGLRNGSLYAFWACPEESGASRGYVAAGGPGFSGPRDTVGLTAYKTAEEAPR